MRARLPVGLILVLGLGTIPLAAHDLTVVQARRSQLASQRAALEQAEDPAEGGRATCRLNVDLRELPARRAVPGHVRITNVATGRPIRINELYHRDRNWHVLAGPTALTVPQTKVRIEAFHGIETVVQQATLDLTGKDAAEVQLELRRIYEPAALNLRSGNTHLHLMNMTFEEADYYLRTVPRADGLDLVFLSHLRRIPEEVAYITNSIVEQSFAGGSLARLSESGVLYGNGEEHRHNFGPGGQGYGHVMLLNLMRLIEPVSLGPGLMKAGTDGLPLRVGLERARGDGATVIWCHNLFGLEDIPNWLAGTLDAQNIFDGGDHGSYEDTYYRYLNIGLRVPFSTGTDWFLYDFSRVYVPFEGELTVANWLNGLKQGRTYITNGTFLELTADGKPIGETITAAGPTTVRVRARGLGRNAFQRIELIQNGLVVATVACRETDGVYAAELEQDVEFRESGWLALRIPSEAGQNEWGRKLFAHTSPIYVDLAGRRRFDGQVAASLLEEVRDSQQQILKQATFADDQERQRILSGYEQAAAKLQLMLTR